MENISLFRDVFLFLIGLPCWERHLSVYLGERDAVCLSVLLRDAVCLFVLLREMLFVSMFTCLDKKAVCLSVCLERDVVCMSVYLSCWEFQCSTTSHNEWVGGNSFNSLSPEANCKAIVHMAPVPIDQNQTFRGLNRSRSYKEESRESWILSYLWK